MPRRRGRSRSGRGRSELRDHHLVDARADYFQHVLRFLIMGNVRRGQLYPLCVGAERVMQAQTIAQIAKQARKRRSSRTAARLRATTRCALKWRCARSPRNWKSSPPCGIEHSSDLSNSGFLEERKLPVPPYGAAYSVNRGLWGVTIGGKETLTSNDSIPDDAWVLSRDAFSQPREPARHTIGFTQGVPSSLDGRALEPVTLIESLEALAAPYGIGRGIHLGDTIIGTKGRVAFEAPAADVLLTSHRELEKLVLTGRQARIKDLVAQPYGDLVHEGQHLDPVCRDIEALLISSQERVSGEVKVLLRPGNAFVEGVTSPYSLMAASKGVYGEAAGEWTPADALGFSRIQALTGIFYQRAGELARR